MHGSIAVGSVQQFNKWVEKKWAEHATNGVANEVPQFNWIECYMAIKDAHRRHRLSTWIIYIFRWEYFCYLWTVGRTVERKERQPQRERDREERKKERNGQVQQVNEPCYRWETLTHSKLVRVVEERERERCSRTVTLAATLWEEEKCRFSWAQIVGEIVEPREKHVTVSKPERDYYFLPFFLFPS